MELSKESEEQQNPAPPKQAKGYKYCMKCGNPLQAVDAGYFNPETGERAVTGACLTYGCESNSICGERLYFCEFGLFRSTCKRCGKKRPFYM